MNNLLGAKQELLLARIGEHDSARLVLSLLTTARQIDLACAELLAVHDLSEARLAALLAVSAEPGITPGGLAEQLEVTRATVTGLTDGLERLALLERGGNAGDRRSVTLRVTAAGETLLTELTPSYAQWLSQLGLGVTEADGRGALRALSAIQRTLSAEPAATP
ncbi:MarR family winged helix-turn-helix transcriptional regulator [Leucobacter sp. M11]|uniref:MarR family winged helix-turn-helix transcriptional regulator n=1 Tax=Leucobacter sp. M11 TaxID=2993565 RepID=UPI002D7EEE13|nr:MarR family transcriptional regulator [Leucobacter sp. M11]MEB4613653.1 MarR family transcriptional regulator [Leucobacter sp. M11]